jgi:hypothetical protein
MGVRIEHLTVVSKVHEHTTLSGSLAIMAWRVLRLRMEETIYKCGG